MEKIVAWILAAAMSIMPASVSKNYVGSATIEGDCAIHASAYDWGCSIDTIVLSLNAPIDAVSADDFVVTGEKDTYNYMGQAIHSVENLNVVDAWLCDKDGNKVEKSSPYVALKIEVGPDMASPLASSQQMTMNVYAHPYSCNIALADNVELTSKGIEITSFEIDPVPVAMTTNADEFQVNTYTSTSGIAYNYASYTPETKSDTLIVWLHGLGEGAAKLDGDVEKTDPYITCLAAEVPSLISEEFQATVGGANILVPQCPTYWMDSDGACSNYTGMIDADGTSYYTESLHELIAAYKEQCGASKVIIAGCSNGGYMGMVLATTYTNEYDGYVLICEAMPDELLSDEQLQGIKDLPLYFIYSNDDPLVFPSLCEAPTIARLKAMGASNLHVSTSDAVVNLSGEYTDADGSAYKYFGHSSWIYFFNNETSCDDCGMDAWHWIAEQLK